MPDLIDSVRALILQSTGISAIVGTKVYTDQLPQSKSPPAIVLYVETETAHDAMSGPQGFDSASVRVECFGINRNAADQLRQLVRDQIAGFYGIVDGVFIQSVGQRTGQIQTTIWQRAGTDSHYWVTRQNFNVGYSIPTGV